MPGRVEWDQGYATGNAAVDARHRGLLEQCNTLAASLSNDGVEYDAEFRKQLDALMDQARQLFAFEQALLDGCPMLDEHNDEIDEFEFLAADIITEDNFDPIEVQRFLSLWCTGHVAGFGPKYGDWLKNRPGTQAPD